MEDDMSLRIALLACLSCGLLISCGTGEDERSKPGANEIRLGGGGVTPVTPLTCDGTAGQWAGCRGNGCAVCAEELTHYPCYFQNHPGCALNNTCDGSFSTCNAACPQPSTADACGACDGTPGQWNGCRGNGCAVCAELLTNYPCYASRHPGCFVNNTCAGEFFECNANCPAPTSADTCAPPPPPAGFCGDGHCDASLGETCSTCPSDCGTCPGGGGGDDPPPTCITVPCQPI
jgi:hypothetical protein